jgi:hypothetical protein
MTEMYLLRNCERNGEGKLYSYLEDLLSEVLEYAVAREKLWLVNDRCYASCVEVDKIEFPDCDNEDDEDYVPVYEGKIKIRHTEDGTITHIMYVDDSIPDEDKNEFFCVYGKIRVELIAEAMD